MKQHTWVILVPSLVAVLATVAVAVWLLAVPEPPLEARIPGQDRSFDAQADVPDEPLEGRVVTLDGQPSDTPGSWPRFRGAQLDNIYHGDVALARQWPDGGPPQLWSITVGEGFAAPVVQAGRVYMIDYDRDAEEDAVRCLSLDDGRDIWQFRYPSAVKRNHGMSRTIPAVTENHLVTIGPKCHVACLDPTSGEPYWLIDMVREYGTKVPPWYAGQCPLIDGDRVILAPAGPEVLMVALDANTGETIWECPNPRAWQMTHSSIMPMDYRGETTYVYCGSGGVAGVRAEDGALLWDTTEWKVSLATVPSPLVISEDRIFFCGGYDSGALMLRLIDRDGEIDPAVEYRLSPSEFGSTQHTPILFEDHIYGVREKDKQFVCLDLEGNEVWASGNQYRFGLGPYMIADGMILMMDDEGLLTTAELTSEAFRAIDQVDLLSGHDSWGPMALVGGRLIVRDMTEMACFDIRAP